MCLLNVFSVECILILGSCVSAPRRPQGETAQVVLDIKDSFKKFDVRGDGSLNANEFEEWFVSGGRGDARQAKAAFRDVDRSPSLKKNFIYWAAVIPAGPGLRCVRWTGLEILKRSLFSDFTQ
jgi:hypothetical protein